MMWLLTSLLVRLQIGDSPADHLLQMLRHAGIVFLQALPLTIFFFFFFPRFPGKLQMTLHESPTGLTDTLRPGSIEQLAKDDSEAFYVKFLEDGNIPPVDAMYWRAIVLWQYKNGTWTRGQMAEIPESNDSPKSVPHSDKISQEITIFPIFRNGSLPWIAHLQAINADEDTGNWSCTLQRQCGAIELVPTSRLTTSNAIAWFPLMSFYPMRLIRRKLPIPPNSPRPRTGTRFGPEVIALADDLRQKNPDDQAYALSILHYFRHNHFVYSATAENTGTGDWLPNFLFKTKMGFCEHYASAFAVLMRLEKIPTRVVIGYQGADFNPYDSTYIVKQSNAHAWDEVWIAPKKSWVRIDPTAILPPSTNPPAAANGSQQGKDEDEGDLSLEVANHQVTILSGAEAPSWLHKTLVEIQFRRQQMETSWDDLIFSYNPEKQGQLAQALGFGKNYQLIFGLACLVAGGICLFVFRTWIKQKPLISPVEQFYAKFCRSMARSGVPRDIWEGPLAYTERVAEAFPDKRNVIQDAGRLVAQSRYGAVPVAPISSQELESLLASITASQAASSPGEQTSPSR